MGGGMDEGLEGGWRVLTYLKVVSTVTSVLVGLVCLTLLVV
jgi:hypothetical protein